MVDALDVAAGAGLDAPTRHPFINSFRGQHHLTVDVAIVKPSDKEPGRVLGIIEYLKPDGSRVTYLQTLKGGKNGYADKYSLGRFRKAMLGAMNEPDPGEDGYRAFLARALTDQGGEIKGKKVTAIVAPSRNPQYNDVTFEPGHVGEDAGPLAIPSPAEDTPPPVVEASAPSPEEKAKAEGFVRNGDSEWFYKPGTSEQYKLSHWA